MIDGLLAIDGKLLAVVRDLPHPGWLNALFVAASAAGVGGTIWLAAGVVLALTRQIHLRAMLRLVLAIAIVHGVVDVGLKPLIDRPRPAPPVETQLRLIERPTTSSFPSGHAANAAAGAFVITHVWSRVRPAVWAVAFVVGAARVYLGVHYPLDAVAGAVIGLALGWVALHGRWQSRP